MTVQEIENQYKETESKLNEIKGKYNQKITSEEIKHEIEAIESKGKEVKERLDEFKAVCGEQEANAQPVTGAGQSPASNANGNASGSEHNVNDEREKPIADDELKGKIQEIFMYVNRIENRTDIKNDTLPNRKDIELNDDLVTKLGEAKEIIVRAIESQTKRMQNAGRSHGEEMDDRTKKQPELTKNINEIKELTGELLKYKFSEAIKGVILAIDGVVKGYRRPLPQVSSKRKSQSVKENLFYGLKSYDYTSSEKELKVLILNENKENEKEYFVYPDYSKDISVEDYKFDEHDEDVLKRIEDIAKIIEINDYKGETSYKQIDGKDNNFNVSEAINKEELRNLKLIGNTTYGDVNEIVKGEKYSGGLADLKKGPTDMDRNEKNFIERLLIIHDIILEKSTNAIEANTKRLQMEQEESRMLESMLDQEYDNCGEIDEDTVRLEKLLKDEDRD